MEKICICDGLEIGFSSFQFNGSISDMDYGAMVDDKTVIMFALYPDLSGKELILIALL